MSARTHPTHEHSRITVGIVTYNSAGHIGSCLESISAHLAEAFPIVLVLDNASTDGAPEMVRNSFPDALLIKNDRNLGFSKAVNQGLAHLEQNEISSDYILLLNNDAYFVDDSMAGMLAYMDTREDIQAAIPAVFGEEGRLQTGIGGYDLTIKAIIERTYDGS